MAPRSGRTLDIHVPTVYTHLMTTDTITYEYCVMHPDYPEAPHRGPYLHDEPAERWIAEADRLAGDFDSDGLGFYVARRQVGPWERA